MDWLNLMNKAIDYIEENITNTIEVEEVAKIALSSTFHFQRMFYMITGVTLTEYIRRRRLTIATQEIISGKKIIDVAYKYGYETPEAFAKAFKKMYGISPSGSKKPGIKLNSYPRISFHISIKGEKNMDYKIEKKESFTVIGRQLRTTLKDGENLMQIPKFAEDCIIDGSYQWLCSRVGKLGLLDIAKDFDKVKDEFYYMLAIEDTGEDLPEGYVKSVVPAATWAVFESVGALPEAIEDTNRRIFTEWLPSTGYEHDHAPEIAAYPIGDIKSEDYRCEVWVSIKN